MANFHGRTKALTITIIIATISPYQALVRAGHRLKQLKQVHAHLIISGAHRNLSLFTKLTILACSSPSSIKYAKKLSLAIPNPDSYLFNSLIRISSKLGFLNDAVFFYKHMILCLIPPTNYTFTSLIKSCANVCAFKLGKSVHSHAVINGFSLDSFVQTSLVSFYGKCSEVGSARKVFDEMPNKSIVAWNAMISGYEQNGLCKDAVDLFGLMVNSGFHPDSVTFVGVSSACAQLGALELGSWVHDYIVKHGSEVDVVLGTSLINMYARCGNVRKAREVFDVMKDKNVVAWTAMISGYGIHGYGKEAIKIYNSMQNYGPSPNEVTFVAILSACAHAGMVNEGRSIFSSMRNDHGVVPGVEHHVCMVDLLGRAGLLNDAYEHVRVLKRPSPAVWTAMLGACKMHKDFNLGIEAAEELLALEPENPGHYVTLSNVYALAGKMERVEKVRNIMIKKKLKKHVGYSTIEVDQRTYLFSMGDKSHPESIELYGYLDDLMRRISEVGYVSTRESVLHELEEEETEYALRYHSEKLALAFGLMKCKNDASVIRIVKNLRMCEDCHLAIKLISSIIKREIVVRDKLRFHHFRDGVCSCADYW
ncbi:LOW QUALITY PROTEIN: pentatricopeptide repeat-containing protein At2g33760 [Amaranthus tricolor]|uniref:LOW QUALITY PROTEIN: pentatricopeptide repeat-containing protein At2g33760 n=1 Tax=Amaranthus tricolor TaxID=29722 RepID=UPI00258579FB|nr:LOW QUALITY PROTEIN: pentatricopeptide repeat-containing protein At2g33760 [Amaranthus tricolor]